MQKDILRRRDEDIEMKDVSYFDRSELKRQLRKSEELFSSYPP
jgi:hypothetical protein